MVIQLTKQDLDDRIFKYSHQAIENYHSGLLTNFYQDYFSARTYLDMFYELGYQLDDLTDMTLAEIQTCSKKFVKLQVINNTKTTS